MEEFLFAQVVMCFVTDLSPTRQFTVHLSGDHTLGR
jgi:hypothetical protein